MFIRNGGIGETNVDDPLFADGNFLKWGRNGFVVVEDRAGTDRLSGEDRKLRLQLKGEGLVSLRQGIAVDQNG